MSGPLGCVVPQPEEKFGFWRGALVVFGLCAMFKTITILRGVEYHSVSLAEAGCSFRHLDTALGQFAGSLKS
jgi:hypothetical protein